MITISLCMVVKESWKELVLSLDSVKDCVDEIIIVNTGAGTDSRAVCREYASNIYEFKNCGDISAALNYSFTLAKKDYILWLEPGDVLLEADRLKLKRVKAEWDDSSDAIRMMQGIRGSGNNNMLSKPKRPHMVKRTKFFQWQKGLKEYLPVSGRVISTDIVITKKAADDNVSISDLSVYEYKLENGEKLSPREQYYYAGKLLENGDCEEALEYFHRFLKEREGWEGDKLAACDKISDYYRQKGDRENEMKAVFKSFEYGLPRPEFLCRLGEIFTELNDIQTAIFWYKLALSVERPKDNLGFIKKDYWTWFPNVKLAACYCRVGEYENAYRHNEAVLSEKPGDAGLLQNKKLLEELLKRKESGSPEHKEEIGPKRSGSLRIVQVAPDVYPVPPQNYGGIEPVIYEITEELVRQGHEVYLYAPKGSKTSAALIPYQHEGIGKFDKIAEFVINTLPQGIDVIHDHTHISVLGKMNLQIPTVCTIHGTINYRVEDPVFVSKRALEVIGGNHGYYVYNGLNLKQYEFSKEKQDYMLYLGRLDSLKGINHALEVAVRTKKRLVVAGPVHDSSYYAKEVEPVIKNNPNIEYIGPVGGAKKQEVIKHARCMLFPTSWEEPFGLVMIEAMACGTPVLAFPNGAVPEVLEGFPECICRDADEMAEKVLKAEFPDPYELRNYVLKRFTTQNMVEGYLEVYRKVIDKKQDKGREGRVFNQRITDINIIPKKAEPLRIVQIAPNALPCPPKDYGGIERVIYDLTEELVRRGHEVYLYAAEGSRSSGKLMTYEHKGTEAAKIIEFVRNTLPEKVDIIHDHTHASVMEQSGLTIPTVSTIHDSRKNSAKHPVYLCKKSLQNVGMNQGFYAYNGINVEDYEFSDRKEGYLIFMGLLYSHKGITFALDVAERTGQKLVIAGPVYNLDYYRKEIEPRIKGCSNIQYVGSVGGTQRQNLLKNARCMLFPTVWEEPFGLVMIEAMACGTPVLAFGNGAVPEVLAGFPELLCSNVEEMVRKVQNDRFPSPKLLRNYVKNNFSAAIMADRYLEIYNKVIGERPGE